MNIEIANRLIKLRKENGYSQEQLADALNISRQAISKWERGEASPDTDNLIELAKLYGVSVDYLLGLDLKEEKEDPIEEVFNEESKKKQNKFKVIFDSIVGIGSVVLYVILGAVFNLWHPAWLIFLLIIPVDSVIEAISKRKVALFNYPVFITCLYLFLGFQFDLWHPLWILFVTIPLFYVIAGLIDKGKTKK